MTDDELSSMTVSQLKELLKEKGLTVGGKKAELIARLVENSETVAVKSTKKGADSKQMDGDLPFFLAIKEGGMGAVEIDKWKVASYGMAVFMFIMLIIGLNSMSWYSASAEETEDGFLGPMTISMDVDVGLSEMEMKISYGGMKIGMDAPLNECDEGGMSEDGVSCGALSTAGVINKIFIILSLVSIIVLLVFSIGRGFGVFSSGVLDEKSDLIERWGWLIAVASINLGTLLYWMIVGFQSHFEDWEEGLGSMWWMMFLFSLTFAAIVYNERVKSLISKFQKTA
ncbi:MAG: SAP domain-containing protein [Candidatus Thalassarchaeaceae archaeon]|nr:SAP domain-containing protein [Candidatus Thalassarchaeaceae archaeon]